MFFLVSCYLRVSQEITLVTFLVIRMVARGGCGGLSCSLKVCFGGLYH